MEQSDIILLQDGRMLRIEDELNSGMGGLTAVQFIDRDEECYVNVQDLDVMNNLGKSDSVLAAFYAARSVHLRLNRVKKV